MVISGSHKTSTNNDQTLYVKIEQRIPTIKDILNYCLKDLDKMTFKDDFKKEKK